MFSSLWNLWCGREDLNLHTVRHQILSLACLPIPPRPRLLTLLSFDLAIKYCISTVATFSLQNFAKASVT